MSRIFVFGDHLLDEYISGDVRRISPEAPVPILEFKSRSHRLGGASNVAANLSSLGSDVVAFGILGHDEDSNLLSSMLEQRGINTKGIFRSPETRCIVKRRFLSGNSHLLRLDYDYSYASIRTQEIHDSLLSQIESCDILVLSDYGKGTLVGSEKIISTYSRNGMPVIVDPKGLDFSRYQHAFLLTPNETEFKNVVGDYTSFDIFQEKACQLAAEIDLDYLLVTRGSLGMSLFDRSSCILNLPANSVEVFDVTGAGDSVISALSHFYGITQSIEESVVLANKAGSISVAHSGTYTLLASDF
jgi:D-beta-D-heptose 7-phosphate kinase/D-beta-D-heptose 1-phosphate adenosyltransferase